MISLRGKISASRYPVYKTSWVRLVGLMANSLDAVILELVTFAHRHKNRQLSKPEMELIRSLDARVQALSQIAQVDHGLPESDGYSFGFCQVPCTHYLLQTSIDEPDFRTIFILGKKLFQWDQSMRVFCEKARIFASSASDDPTLFVWMTATEAADFVGVSSRTMTRWIVDGKISQIDAAGTKYKFFRHELEAFKSAKTAKRKRRS